MIDGDLNDFIDRAANGMEIQFQYKGKKYMLEGMPNNSGAYVLYLFCYSEKAASSKDVFNWVGRSTGDSYPVEEFLNAKIWDGKNFYEIEQEVQWIDD